VETEQPARSGFVPLQNGGTLGQTFVARYDGLAGIAVFLRPGQPGEGRLDLHLRKITSSGPDLASATLPLGEITSAGYYRFDFPPLAGTRNQDYVLQLELTSPGTVEVGSAPGDTYLNGALYQDGVPQDRQLTFRLAYAPVFLLRGLLLNEALRWVGWTAAGAFLFLLPGWGLLSLILPSWRKLDLGEKLGLAGGLSLAIYPLLFLWTDLAGLRLGSWYAWLPPLAGLGCLAVSGRRRTADTSTTDRPQSGAISDQGLATRIAFPGQTTGTKLFASGRPLTVTAVDLTFLIALALIPSFDSGPSAAWARRCGEILPAHRDGPVDA
jgi:hypothetical protein